MTQPVPLLRRPGPLPHLMWEGMLLLVVLGVVVAASLQAQLFTTRPFWWTLAVLGLLATGLALSFRTNTPNLAVGGFAVLSAIGYAQLVNEAGLPALLAALIVLAAMLLIGVLLGLLAGLLSVPAWALSLMALAFIQATVMAMGSLAPVATEPVMAAPWGWLALFLLCSLGGGAVLLIPPLRKLLLRDRAAGPVQFGLSRLLLSTIGFGGSTFLAALAGLAQVSQLRAAMPDFSLTLLMLALAAVLIGGVSAYGGRGGVVGTVLGATLVAALVTWSQLSPPAQAGAWLRFAIAGVLILGGLGLGRLLELLAPLTPPPAPPPAPARPSPSVPGAAPGAAAATAPGPATPPAADRAAR